jgi:prepilin-type N-terminal cleavage/methylation domain-containing protein
MTGALHRLRCRIASERGYTLVELLQVTVILGVILAAITTLFVRASIAEVDMNRRFQAQQEARLAVDRMRREIHCASLVTPSGASSSITVTLPAGCPTVGGGSTTVVYDTQLVSTGRYQLRRAGVRVADYVTAPAVFNYTSQSTSSLGKLSVTLPVNLKPADTGKEWKLEADIVLRNTTRS